MYASLAGRNGVGIWREEMGLEYGGKKWGWNTSCRRPDGAGVAPGGAVATVMLRAAMAPLGEDPTHSIN